MVCVHNQMKWRHLIYLHYIQSIWLSFLLKNRCNRNVEKRQHNIGFSVAYTTDRQKFWYVHDSHDSHKIKIKTSNVVSRNLCNGRVVEVEEEEKNSLQKKSIFLELCWMEIQSPDFYLYFVVRISVCREYSRFP